MANRVEMGRAALPVKLVRIKIQTIIENIEQIISHYRLHKTQCDKRHKEIEHLKQEREQLNNPHWTEGLLRPVMAVIARLTPEIDWENNDEFYPTYLRGAITVFGRTKRGRPVCITFTESGHDLLFDSGQIHNSFSLKVLKDIGGTNNIMESVGDEEPLLWYIWQQMLFLEQHPEMGK